MLDVIPGILEKDFQEIEKKLQIIKPFSGKVHIDILDGKFTDQVSFLESEKFSKYKDDFFMEAHLMVENPEGFIESFAKAGFKRFIGQIEKMGNIDEFLARGQLLGEVGLALDIDTKIESIKVPFDDLDVILLMAVKAGKSGQDFNQEVLGKIKSLREKTEVPIEIDGGINKETLVEAKAMGAERFVTTSFIFKSDNPENSYELLLSSE
jgi:ribulose-phosphate 3-epimerase